MTVNAPQPPPVQPQMMPPPQMPPQQQPYTVNPDMSQPVQPSLDDVAKIQDILANHAKASWGQRHMRAKSALVDALTNFTYAMGQGMQASAQYPGRRGSMAGMGAALAAPQQLQYIRQQQAMQQQQRQAEMMHAQAAQQNAQTLEGYRRAQEHNLEPTTITNPYTGESETVPANQVGKRLTDFAKMQADKDKSTNMLDLAYNKRGMKVIDPAKARSADNYAPMADDDPNLPQDVRALRQKETAANALAQARTELAQAQAMFEKAKNDPNSPIFKQAQQRLDTAVANSDLARQNVVRLNNLQEANLYGTVGGQQLPGGPTDAQGQPIGLKVAQLANSLGGQAPQQIKTQTAAAITTKEMIEVVRKLVTSKPYLVGPAAGRMAEAAQGIGTSFGLQDPQDEQDAALLSGHLGYLFANELRASFPNRPPREIIQMLKDKSAQMKDNPNILEGFLKSASNNADIALKTAAKFNIPQAATALGQGAPAPATPNTAVSLARAKAGDVITVPKSAKVPSGKVRKLSNGGYEAVP